MFWRTPTSPYVDSRGICHLRPLCASRHKCRTGQRSSQLCSLFESKIFFGFGQGTQLKMRGLTGNSNHRNHPIEYRLARFCRTEWSYLPRRPRRVVSIRRSPICGLVAHASWAHQECSIGQLASRGLQKAVQTLDVLTNLSLWVVSCKTEILSLLFPVFCQNRSP